MIGALPRIRDMGFDVLYLTPIHPIGRKNRKGKNKGTATVTKEAVEDQEDVPPPQQPQPQVSLKSGLDAAIDNMVSTGNFQSALEQINWAWR